MPFQKRRRILQAVKLILPLLALSLMALVIIYFDEAQLAPRDEADDALGQKPNVSLEVKAARYEGYDAKMRAYVVMAEEVVKSLSDEDDHLVHLKKPSAELMVSAQDKLALKAEAGVFNIETALLELKGEIAILSDQASTGRTILKADNLAVDLKTGQASSPSVVRVERPDFTLEAKALKVENNGMVITFEGPAQLTFKGKGG
jgi:LPS export ABC transporter protein LptC